MSIKAVSLTVSLCLFLAISSPAQAQSAQSVNVNVQPSEFSNKLGSFVQGEVTLENTSEQEITLKIGIANSDDQKIGANVTGFFGSLRFYGDLPEDFEDILDDSRGDISKACEDRDDSNDLDNWCDGEKILTLTLEAEQKITVPYTFRIPLTVEATSAFMLVESVDDTESQQEESADEIAKVEDLNKDRTGEEDQDKQENDDRTVSQAVNIFSQELQYEPPITEVISGEIKELKLTRSFGKINFWGWIRAGFRETYEGSVLIENTGTKVMPYTITLNVERSNTGKEEIQQSGEINPAQEKVQEFEAIAMPRLGTALINAQLSYEGSDGPKIIQTEQARVANTPIKEMLTAVIALIGAALSFLAFRSAKSKQMQKLSRSRMPKQKRKKNLGIEEELMQDETAYESAQDFEFDDEMPKYSRDEIVVTPAPKKAPRKSAKKGTKKVAKKASAKAATRRTPSKSVMAQMQEQDFYEANPDSLQSQEGGRSSRSLSHSTDTLPKRGSRKNDRMDIDWIGEDDTVFDSAMRLQEKKMNMKVGGMVLGLLAMAVITALLLGNKYFFANQEDESVSISELNESTDEGVNVSEDIATDDDQGQAPLNDDSEDLVTDLQASEEVEISQKEKEKEKEKEEDLEQSKEVSDMVVQVLNGGSTAGAAGDLTQALEAKGYEVLSASNARNDYVGNVVYYAQDKEDIADQLIKDIGSAYGAIDIENEQTVLNAYNADLVVVLGS